LVINIIHRCDALGLTETNPGTESSDSECGNPLTDSTAIAVGVIVPLLIITGGVFTIICFRKKKYSKHSGKLYSNFFRTFV